MSTKRSELTPFSDNFYIVLDTNILINVHKRVFYTLQTLKSILAANEDKLWIPKHVWEEYSENWSKISKQCKKNLENLRKQAYEDISKFKIRDAANLVDSPTQTEITSSLTSILEAIKKFYANEKKKYSESQDIKIFDEMKEWLATRVGDGFSIHEIVKIMEEGDVRYRNLVPPGYKDSDKKNGNAFGDLIIWKEMIDKSKKTNADIVFVTEDVKSDWDDPKSRNLLGQEFKEETGKNIQVFKLADYREIYSQKPATKRISEALAQLDENREMIQKIYKELLESASTKVIINMLNQNEFQNNMKLFSIPSISQTLSSNLINQSFIDRLLLASNTFKFNEIPADCLPSTPPESVLAHIQELISNMDIEDTNSTDCS